MGRRKKLIFFANLEKKAATHKIIHQLKDNKNNIETNQTNILNQINDFYQRLYSKDKNIENCEDSSFFCNEINTLEQNNEDEQSGYLSEYECGISLKEMKNNKSPGSDGLTADFYKIFWNDIKHTELQKQSIITLLPKKDKDVLSLNNWRPISLQITK